MTDHSAPDEKSTSTIANPLDCTKRQICVFWFALGAALGISVMSAFGAGHWQSLLRVGSQNPLLATIEAELGPVSSPDPTGHDGQLYYLIARDPLGIRGTPEAIAAFDNNGARYRYRRILFPLLAGGFGLFEGRGALFGMILWLAVAMGIATVAIADISFHLNLRRGTVVVATTNAGALVSLLLLTADALAVAFALAGISMVIRSRLGWGMIFFALAAMTKEAYVLVPISVAGWLWQQHGRGAALSVLILPAVPLIIWSTWLLVAMPAASPAVRNVGLPFVGLSDAVPIWIHGERNVVELFLIGFAALMFPAATVMLVIGRTPLLRWLILPWLCLASVVTLAVWGKPNNVSRAFAILWPLTVLLASERLSDLGATHGREPMRVKGQGNTGRAVLS